MDFLQGLPVWVQLVVAFLIAAVLIFMNIGWLIQARAWLERKGRRPTGKTGAGSTPGSASPTDQSERERI
jgi:hypothetical protein